MAYATEAALRAALAGALQVAVDTVTDKIQWQGVQFNLSIVYGNGNNGYERTYQFLDAWKTTAGGGGGVASGSYEYDPSKLHSGGPSVWNFPYGAQHQSVKSGASSASSVADYVYDGYGGIWSGGGRDAFKPLEQWLLGKMVTLFKRGCSAGGLVVTKVGGYDVSGLR